MTLSQRDDYGRISVSTNMKLQIDLFCISEIKCTSLSIEIKKMKFFYQPAKTHFTVMNTRDNKYTSSKILWIRYSIYKICITLLFMLKYVFAKYILKTSLVSSLPLLPPKPCSVSSQQVFSWLPNCPQNHKLDHSAGKPGSPNLLSPKTDTIWLPKWLSKGANNAI